MNISGWINKHISPAGSDYRPKNSFVNEARRAGFGRPLAGAGIGAVTGAVGGYAAGMRNLANDEVTIVDTRTEFLRPELVGADYDPEDSTLVPEYDMDGNFTGYRTDYDPADWDPIIEKRNTGLYFDKQEFRTSAAFGPLKGALVGAGIGLVVGGIVGVIAENMIKDDFDDWRHRPDVPTEPKKQQMAQMADKAPLAGAVVGAAVGTGLGLYSSHVAEGKNQVLTQTVSRPVTEKQTIGYIPYVSDERHIPDKYFGKYGKLLYKDLPKSEYGEIPFEGREAINRTVPTGEFEEVTLTDNSHSFSPIKGALVGAATGGVIGLATGVAAGVLMKAAAGEDPPR